MGRSMLMVTAAASGGLAVRRHPYENFAEYVPPAPSGDGNRVF
jgi:hypothetical protein